MLQHVVFLLTGFILGRVSGFEIEKAEESTLGYEWLPHVYKQAIPDGAIVGGIAEDLDTKAIYKLNIGRAMHMGEVIPGKVQSPDAFLYCIYNGSEHWKKEFQILVGPDEFYWVKMTPNRHIPINSIKGGEMSTGSPYYIGRAKHDGRHKQIGKVDSRNKILYTSINNIIKSWMHYEILVWGEEDYNTKINSMHARNVDNLQYVSRNQTNEIIVAILKRYKERININHALLNNVTIHGNHNHTWIIVRGYNNNNEMQSKTDKEGHSDGSSKTALDIVSMLKNYQPKQDNNYPLINNLTIHGVHKHTWIINTP